jgi:hypothetical protein
LRIFKALPKKLHGLMQARPANAFKWPLIALQNMLKQFRPKHL